MFFKLFMQVYCLFEKKNLGCIYLSIVSHSGLGYESSINA